MLGEDIGSGRTLLGDGKQYMSLHGVLFGAPCLMVDGLIGVGCEIKTCVITREATSRTSEGKMDGKVWLEEGVA